MTVDIDGKEVFIMEKRMEEDVSMMKRIAKCFQDGILKIQELEKVKVIISNILPI